MAKMKKFNNVEVPSADSVRVWFCGYCNHPHLILVDENDRPIAEATISDRVIDLLFQASMRAPPKTQGF